MGSKTYVHNGKEVVKQTGKNIRVSVAAWDKIRKHCISNGIIMGAFVENAALTEIAKSKKNNTDK